MLRGARMVEREEARRVLPKDVSERAEIPGERVLLEEDEMGGRPTGVNESTGNAKSNPLSTRKIP